MSSLLQAIRLIPEIKRTKDDQTVEIHTAKNGEQTATLNGTFLHSRFDPCREAKKLASTLLEHPADAIVVFGFGLGYHVRELSLFAPSLPLLVVEPVPALLAHAADIHPAGWWEELRAVTLWKPDDWPGMLAFLQDQGIRNPAVFSLKAYQNSYPDEWRAIETEVRSFRNRTTVNRNTLKRFGKLWVRNILRNRFRLKHGMSLSRLKGVFSAIPALVCGAGPTLDENPRLLRAFADRAVVIAVDTAVPRLEQIGVPVDIVVAVDPQYWNTRHLDRIVNRHSILVTEPAVHPRAVRLWDGPLFIAESVFPLGRIITGSDDAGARLGAGGSVATTAWDLARYVGSPEVYRAGVDLGFPASATHCRDSYFENRIRTGANRREPGETGSFRYLYHADPRPVPSAGSTPVLSDKKMEIYREWFREQIARPGAPRSWFLSSSSSAIRGIEVIPDAGLEDLGECRSSVNEILGRTGQVNLSTPAARVYTDNDLSDALADIDGLATRAITACERILSLSTITPADFSGIESLERQILENRRRDIVGFLISESTETIFSAAATSFEESVRQSLQIHRALHDSAEFHRTLLKRFSRNG